MSKPPVMVLCPKCQEKIFKRGITSTGFVIRKLFMPISKTFFQIRDICDRCGGSGRVAR
jgi:predicted nucleic-acid-binding Zn-ribbon protein